MTDLDRALQVARETAQAAGALALEGFRSGASVAKKGRIDLVTEYDLRSEREIRSRLSAAFPDHRIVGEELEDVEGSGDDAPVWYVDPIDGTTNFAHGHFFFSVSIALWCRGEPRVGVVFAPALRTEWSGRAGGGAFRNGARIHVSERAALEDAICASGFPYDRGSNPDDNLREVGAFVKRTRGLRRCGSAAIDLALVADGTYDFYWEKQLSPWDMCAGALLVVEAGGRLSDYDGTAADPRTGRLVASNGHLHGDVLATIAEARADLDEPRG